MSVAKLLGVLFPLHRLRKQSSASETATLPFEPPFPPNDLSATAEGPPIGVIAGNGSFPFYFSRDAIRHGHRVIVVAHRGETDDSIEQYVHSCTWIRVGELGRLIETFRAAGVREVAMAGGINRVRLFGGVKLDARGAALLYKLRSAKDDVIMRGIADELANEGMEVIPCTRYLQDCLAREGALTASTPTTEELADIDVGVAALRAMSAQDIGQLVVVREGVVVAVEAVEGSDRTILRGGELGGKGAVVVKCAKPTQDMRFDVPTIGERTVQTMIRANIRVLAIEAGRCLILEEPRVRALADRHSIAVVGIPPLI